MKKLVNFLMRLLGVFRTAEGEREKAELVELAIEPITIDTPLPVEPRKNSAAYLRRRVADTAAGVLDRFEGLSKANLGGAGTAEARAVLSNLWGCDFHLMDEVSEETQGFDRFHLSPNGDQRSDIQEIAWPIDLAFANQRDSHLLLCRVWTRDPRDLRGTIKIAPPKIVTVSAAFVYPDGTWNVEEDEFGLLGGVWRSLRTNVVLKHTAKGMLVAEKQLSPHKIEEAGATINMAMSMAITERYSWHAAFGYSEEDGPRVLLPTSATGCLELFKTREIVEGKTRRDALRHWVSNHFRSTEESDLVYVRDHLRGATRFCWSDMRCELLVSAFDLEKNEFFKLQAAKWRAARKHNHVRVRLKRLA